MNVYIEFTSHSNSLEFQHILHVQKTHTILVHLRSRCRRQRHYWDTHCQNDPFLTSEIDTESFPTHDRPVGNRVPTSRCNGPRPPRSEPSSPTCQWHDNSTSRFKLSKRLSNCSLYSKYSGVVYSNFISNDPPCLPPRSNSSIVFLFIPALYLSPMKLPHAIR